MDVKNQANFIEQSKIKYPFCIKLFEGEMVICILDEKYNYCKLANKIFDNYIIEFNQNKGIAEGYLMDLEYNLHEAEYITFEKFLELYESAKNDFNNRLYKIRPIKIPTIKRELKNLHVSAGSNNN